MTDLMPAPVAPPNHQQYSYPGQQPPVFHPPARSPWQPPPPRRRNRRLLATVLAVSIAAASGVGGGIVGVHLAGTDSATVTPAPAAANASPVSAGLSLSDVVTKVSPSVVSILVSGTSGSGEGSGIILSADGRIVTNAHVVAVAGRRGTIKVAFADGRTVAATLVGSDTSADLAVIQAEGVSGLTPATFGDSGALQVGDTVLAFGSPLGLEGTVTSGIVSALDRSLTESEANGGTGARLTGLIQTDAPINPGNSGGALVNTAGQVVGIAVAIATTGSDSGNIGVGFAIPVGTASAVINRLSS